MTVTEIDRDVIDGHVSASRARRVLDRARRRLRDIVSAPGRVVHALEPGEWLVAGGVVLVAAGISAWSLPAAAIIVGLATCAAGVGLLRYGAGRPSS